MYRKRGIVVEEMQHAGNIRTLMIQRLSSLDTMQYGFQYAFQQCRRLGLSMARLEPESHSWNTNTLGTGQWCLALESLSLQKMEFEFSATNVSGSALH